MYNVYTMYYCVCVNVSNTFIPGIPGIPGKPLGPAGPIVPGCPGSASWPRSP